MAPHTCEACFHHCCLDEGQLGFCRARKGGVNGVESLSYGKITSLALDPIEKKPLAFFRPNAKVLSIGSFGCNMRCPFCQNASIAQVGEDKARFRFMSAAEVVEQALNLRDRGCEGVAYTYNEPATFYEFMIDCAHLAREQGLLNVVVSNGMIEGAPLVRLAQTIDAANIDVKCFTEEGYRSLSGDLDCVKHTVETLVEVGVHVELTTLVVPGLSDSTEDMARECSWIASLDPDIPLHLTRFFPRHHMRTSAPTPMPVLEELRGVARERLNRVVLGNV